MRVLCPFRGFGWSKGAQRVGRGVPYSLKWLHRPTSFSLVPLLTPLPTTLFYCVALVLCFFRDTILELRMTLMCLSGAKSLRDPLVSQLLGEWVASSPVAKARWYEATEVAQLPLIHNKQIEAVQQYVSVLFPGTRMDRATYGFECPQLCLPACVGVHDPSGGALTPPQRASHSPNPSLHVTASWTRGRSW